MSYAASLADLRECLACGTLPNLAPTDVREYRVILAQPYGTALFQWEGKAISWVHAVWECMDIAALAGVDPSGFQVFARRDGATMTGTIGGRWNFPCE